MTPAQNTSSHRRTRGARLLLTIGFVALTVAILAAYRTPARELELSIYRSTPFLFWAGVGVALLIGVLIAFRAEGPGRVSQGCYLLSGGAALSIVALPILRGYHFYGRGDSLSHLGWTRMFGAGTLHPVQMRYPGVHSISIIVSRATGLDDTAAIMLTVVTFFAVFLLFIPLCVRAITGTGPALLVGVVSALLLLPINNVAVHVVAHPITQSILFSSVVLYLLLAYTLDRGERYPVWGDVSATGLLLGLTATTVILMHPQQALTLIGAFVTISALQYVYREYRSSSHPIKEHRPLYAQTGLFALLFLVWSLPQERVRVAIVDVATGLIASEEAGTAVAGRTVSLSILGGSIEEMFLKLFGVSLVYAILASVLGLAVLAGSVSRVDPDGTAFLQYLIATILPASGLFVLFLLADAGDMYFRYFGFVMLVTTVFGGVAMTVGLDRLGDLGTRPALATVVGLAFVAFLVVQLLALHPSPYMYQPNSQVGETEMSGYETTLEDRDEEIPFAGIRGGPRRFAHAYYGTESRTADELLGARGTVPEEAFNGDLAANYDQRTYVPISEADHKREVGLYDGFRYSEEGFEQLEHSTEIDRVQSNGQYDLYLIDPDEEA